MAYRFQHGVLSSPVVRAFGFIVLAWSWLALPLWGATASDWERLAPGYEAILERNPSQEVALRKIWALAAVSGRTAELIDRYREKSRQDARAAYPLGFFLEEEGQLEPALEAYRQTSGDARLHRAAIEAGLRLLKKENRAEQAAVWLEEKLGLPDWPKADRVALLRQLAELKRQSGGESAASAVLQSALELDPENRELREYCARWSEQIGDASSAREHWLWLARNQNGESAVQAWRQVAVAEEMLGQIPRALDAYFSALALLDATSWLHAETATDLLALAERSNTLTEVEASLRDAHAQRPNDFARLQLLIWFYESTGRPDEAKLWLEKAAGLAPRDTALRLRLARYLPPDQALAVLTKLPVETTNAVALALECADLELRLGRDADAEARLSRLLEGNALSEIERLKVVDFLKARHFTAVLEAYWGRQWQEGHAASVLERARYHLENRDYTSAKASLQKLASLPSDRSELRPMLLEAAQLLQQAGLFTDALPWAQRAHQLQAGEESADLVSLLLVESGDREGADFFLEGYLQEVAKVRLPPETLDRRFWQLVQQRPVGLIADLGQTRQQSAQVQQFIKTLRENLPAAEMPFTYQRLARWQRWNQDSSGAMVTLQAGLTKFPESPDLLDDMAVCSAAEGDFSQAIALLERKALVRPEEKQAISRRIGYLKMDRGDLNGALRHFNKIASQASPPLQALFDLAAAQQRADQWYQALDTWMRAYHASIGEQRWETRQPIVNACERLGLIERALDFLDALAREQTDESRRLAGYREAWSLARRHGKTEEYLQLVDQRSQMTAKDHALQRFVREAFLEEGQSEAAERVLSRVQASSPSRLTALELALEDAEKSGSYDQAAALARQLIWMDDPDLPGRWLRWASLVEQVPESREAAAQAWQIIQARFPRDPEVLGQAAAFYEKQAQWAELERALRELASIKTPRPEQLAQLARLAEQRGDWSQALADYEAIFSSTLPVPEDVIILPTPPEMKSLSSQTLSGLTLRLRNALFAKMQARTLRKASASETEKEKYQTRIEALEGISRLRLTQGTLDAWLKSVDAIPGITEKIWAYRAADRIDDALEVLARYIEAHLEDLSAQQAFVFIGLEGKRWERVAEWVGAAPNQTTERSEIFLWELARYASQHSGELTSDVLEKLFPPDKVSPNLRLQGAQILAGAGLWREAVRLGDSALNDLPPANRAGFALEVASWKIALLDLDGAIRVLDNALIEPGTTLDASVMTALRTRFLLTPLHERPDFIRRLEERKNLPLVTRHAQRALLDALSGHHEKAAREAVHYVTEQAAGGNREPGLPFSLVLRSEVALLRQWGLLELAVAVLEGALAQDEALMVLRGEQNPQWLREVRIERGLTRLAQADPVQAAIGLSELAREDLSSDEWANAAGQLEVIGLAERAALLYRKATDVNPQNQNAWIRRMALLQREALFGESELAWQEAAAVEPNLPKPMSPADALRARIELNIKRMDSATASALIQAGLKADAHDPMLNRLQLHELIESHKDDAARRVLREMPNLGSAETFDAETAILLEREGSPIAIDQWLKSRITRSSQPAWQRLCGRLLDFYGVHQQSDALSTWQELLVETGQWALLGRLKARAGGMSGSAEESAQYFRTLPSPEARDQAIAAFLEADGYLPEPVVLTWINALPSFVAKPDAPRLRAVLEKLSHLPNFRASALGKLREMWLQSPGDAEAGLLLARQLLQENDTDALARFFQEAARFPDSEGFEKQLGFLCQQAGQPGMAGKIFAKLCDDHPEKTEYRLALALALWQEGRRSEAIRQVQLLERLAPLEPRLYSALAEFYLKIQRPRRALAVLDRAPSSVPSAQNFNFQAHRLQARFALGEIPVDGSWIDALGFHQRLRFLPELAASALLQLGWNHWPVMQKHLVEKEKIAVLASYLSRLVERRRWEDFYRVFDAEPLAWAAWERTAPALKLPHGVEVQLIAVLADQLRRPMLWPGLEAYPKLTQMILASQSAFVPEQQKALFRQAWSWQRPSPDLFHALLSVLSPEERASLLDDLQAQVRDYPLMQAVALAARADKQDLPPPQN